MPKQMPDPILPFGKHTGKHASEVEEVRYLDWMLEVAREPFQTELLAHLNTRADWRELDED